MRDLSNSFAEPLTKTTTTNSGTASYNLGVWKGLTDRPEHEPPVAIGSVFVLFALFRFVKVVPCKSNTNASSADDHFSISLSDAALHATNTVMQAGFAMLEVGSVPAKHTKNLLIKVGLKVRMILRTSQSQGARKTLVPGPRLQFLLL